MLRLLILSLIALSAWAACPTSTDATGTSWPNTCFVSRSGDDSTGTGAWNTPFLTVGKAYTTMGTGTGDSIVIRGGRYFGDGNTIYQPAIAKCSASKPCTIRSYPGEVVIIDGSTMTYRAFYMDKFGSLADSPPYSTDPHDGHWRMTGLRFENLQSGAIWNQGISDDITLKSIRIHGTAGFAFSTCGSCRIFGTHVEVDGNSTAKGIEGAPFQCSGGFPTYYQSPWSSGLTNYQADYWQIVNESPLVAPNTYPAGCNDLVVQDSTFIKRHSTGADTFGFETANGVTLERFHARSPFHQSDDTLWNFWGGSGGTDTIDIKGNNIVIRETDAIGGKGALKVWGSARVENTLVVGGDDTGEGALSGMQRYYQSASNLEFPTSVEYRTIRAVFNDPYTNDAIVYASKIVGGMGAIEGTPIIIESVPGCTGINGPKRVRHIYHGNGYPTMYSVENMDGSQFTCPDSYNVGAHAFRVMPSDSTWFSPVAFTSGSADVSVTGLISTYFVFLNDRIRFQTSGTLPAGLTPGTDYWVTYRSGTTVRLSATRGGTPITFAGAGTGTHTAQIIDERTSYAGTVRIAPYTQLFQHISVLTPHRYATSLCSGCDDRVGTSIGYTFTGDVISSPAQGAVRRVYYEFAKPRAMVSNGSPTVTLEYFDSAALAVGQPVYFESTCQLPTPLAPKTAYYVVASDSVAGTIQVSATLGGAAISNYVNNVSCVWVKNYLTSPTFSSSVVSASGTALNVGDTVTAGGYASAPYPVVNGQTYYVASESSVTIAGQTFAHLTLKNASGDPSPISFSAPSPRFDQWLRIVDPPGSTTFRNHSISSYTSDFGSDRNLYYSPDVTRAFCAKNKADGGIETGGSCTTSIPQLTAIEPASTIADPAVDYVSGRATSSSPAALTDKGSYAALNSVALNTATAQLLRFKAPAATDACTIIVSANSDFSAPIETINSPAGFRWREVVLGASTPLSASTIYYRRIVCGYDSQTGSAATTAAPGGGTKAVRVTLSAGTASQTQAALDYSTDGTTWTSGTPAACSSGCTLSATLPIGVLHHIRDRRLSAEGSILGVSAVRFLVP